MHRVYGSCPDTPFLPGEEQTWQRAACAGDAASVSGTGSGGKHPSHRESSWSHLSYRPLVVLTLRWDVLRCGMTLDAGAMHTTNIALYAAAAATAAVVFHVLAGALVRAAAPLSQTVAQAGAAAATAHATARVASLLFAAHPLHAEVAANVTTRAESICALFLLPAVAWAARRAATRPRDTVPAQTGLRALVHALARATATALVLLAATLTASLCKETGLLLPPLVGVTEAAVRLAAHASKKDSRRTATAPQALRRTIFATAADLAPRAALLIAVTAAAYALRIRLLLGGYEMSFRSFDNPIAFFPSALDQARTITYVQAFAASLLLYPWRQSYSHGAIAGVRSWSDPRLAFVVAVWAAAAGVCATAVITLARAARTPRRNGSPLPAAAAAGVLWSGAVAVITYLPSAHILFSVAFVVAERTLFLPSFAACAAIAIAVQASTNAVPLARTAATGVIVAVYAARVRGYIPFWADDTAIMEGDLSAYPERNVLSSYYKATRLMYNGHFDEALALAEAVGDWDPKMGDAFGIASQLHWGRIKRYSITDPAAVTAARSAAVTALHKAFDAGWLQRQFHTNLGALMIAGGASPTQPSAAERHTLLGQRHALSSEVSACQRLVTITNAACVRAFSKAGRWGDPHLAAGLHLRLLHSLRTKAELSACANVDAAVANAALFWALQGHRERAVALWAAADRLANRDQGGSAGNGTDAAPSAHAVLADRFRSPTEPFGSLLALWRADVQSNGLAMGDSLEGRRGKLEAVLGRKLPCVMQLLWY